VADPGGGPDQWQYSGGGTSAVPTVTGQSFAGAYADTEDFGLMVYGTGLSGAGVSFSGTGITVEDVIDARGYGIYVLLSISDLATADVRTMTVTPTTGDPLTANFEVYENATPLLLFPGTASGSDYYSDLVTEDDVFGTATYPNGLFVPGILVGEALVGVAGVVQAGIRFDSVAIPANHVVVTALLGCTLDSVAGGGVASAITAEYEANPAAIHTTSHKPSTWTPTSTTVPITTFATGTRSFDVRPLIAEIRDNKVWESGNAINFKIAATAAVAGKRLVFSDVRTSWTLSIVHRPATRAELESFALPSARMVHFWPLHEDDLQAGTPVIRGRRVQAGGTYEDYFYDYVNIAANPNGITNFLTPTGAGANTARSGSEFGGFVPQSNLMGHFDITYSGQPYGGWPGNLRTKSYIIMQVRDDNYTGPGSLMENYYGVDNWLSARTSLYPDSSRTGVEPSCPPPPNYVFVASSPNEGMSSAVSAHVARTAHLGETFINAGAWDYVAEVAYVWAKDGDGVHTASTATPKPSGTTPTPMAGYDYAKGVFYGGAMFEFDGALPSDWQAAVEWMGENWRRGNKAIWPAWQ
jgi:hypothetical protein